MAWGILIVVLILDLYIFKFVTNKPLGLAPSDLTNSPKINISIDPAPNIPLEVNKPLTLIPSLNYFEIIRDNQQAFEVIGYGRAGKSLYVQIRLHQGMDFSLKKGWGKAIQLLDNQNRNYLYDSYSLPFGVQLYDKLVDLPDDFRANINIMENCYKDIFLCFPEHPEKSIPVQLRLIESFQGNSPANPGHIYYDIPMTNISGIQQLPPIMAHDSYEVALDIAEPFNTHPEISLSVQKFIVDNNLLPKVSISFNGETGKIITVKDSVLLDQNGQNYNMFHLEEGLKYTINDDDNRKVELMFERLPSAAKISAIWFKAEIDEMETEVIIPL